MSPNRKGRRHRLRSLKSRLALWVLLPTVLLMLIDLGVTYHNSSLIATLVQQQLLHGSAKIISEQLVFADGSYEISVPPAAFELFDSRHKDRIYFSVHTKEGKLIAGDDELAPYDAALQIDEAIYFVTRLRGEPVRVIAYAHALTSSSTGDFAITQVAQTLRGHNEFRDGLLWSTIRGHLVLLVIMAVSLVMALRWTLSPLEEFSRTLARRQSGSLEKVGEENAPTELAPVIHALNDYVARLDRTLSSYEKFVSNTAHHLRTSFAIMASQIDFGKRLEAGDKGHAEVLGAIQQSLGYCAKVINQLLLLASVEHPRQLAQTAGEVCLAEVIMTVIEEMAPLAQQRQIELGVDDFDDSVRIAAQPQLLREVVANLVDNAIQHMNRPGAVPLSLRRAAGHAVLSVADNGVGIPEALQGRVFERFFRIDESKSNSSGLGLAIVKEICDALGAEIALCSPERGTGLQVVIAFPIIAAPDGRSPA
jgi:two-component system, OmpR family, sensor histidine kinase TctE